MQQSEIERLRKAICRSYGSSPHKKKYWLALLENHAGALKSPGSSDAAGAGLRAASKPLKK